MSSVLEKYVGRKPQLFLIEKELVHMVDRIKSDVYTLNNRQGDVSGRDLNNSIGNKKIERLFKEFFGLKEFVLNWLWTPLPDAHTMVKSFQILDSNFEKGKDGRDFNKKLFIGVNISTGLVTSMNMEADEIMAIILHEIGHSFDRSIAQVLSSTSPIIVSKTPETLGVGSGILHAIFSDIIGSNVLYTHARTYSENIKDAFKPVTKLYNFALELAGITLSVLPQSIQVIDPKSLLKNFFRPFNLLFLYSVEKHSDGFAVDYGYGKELASALNKLDRSKDHPKMEVPVLNWIYAFDDVVHEMILEPLTGYPSIHNRQRSALDRLKLSAKDKDIDPRTRRELERQIKQFEEYYEDYMSLDGKENKKYMATWLYRKFVDKFFGGKLDVREFIYRLSNDSPNNHKYIKEYEVMKKDLEKKINKVNK